MNERVAHFREIIEQKLKSAVSQIALPSPLLQACHYVAGSGGKRLRPLLTALIADHLRRENFEAALSVEFFHLASLIADDLPCMDNEEKRRGTVVVHRIFPESIALLTSYAFIAEGYRHIQKSGFTSEALCYALGEACEATGGRGAAGGQAEELFASKSQEEPLLEIVRLKSGKLFQLAFVLGWLAGEGDPKMIDEVKQAGLHYGTAFQLADDLADEEEDRKKKNRNLSLCLGRHRAEELFLREGNLACQGLEKMGLSAALFDNFISCTVADRNPAHFRGGSRSAK